MTNPRLLDLYCCEGGAAEGYRRAGFDVVGVDVTPQGRYPFEFHQADALEFLAAHGREFDAVHASPPCQGESRHLRHLSNPVSRLIVPTRMALQALRVPWALENVEGAAMAVPLVLCGTMFGLPIRRHRLFETSHLIMSPAPCDHSRPAMNPHYAPSRKSIGYAPEKQWADAMGVPWMSKHGARQAIPPVYTEFVGRHLMAAIVGSVAS